MSGATRPSIGFGLMDLTLTVCQAGRGKTVLTPPPEAPPPWPVLRPGVSHQVTSLTVEAEDFSMVPPTPRVLGLALGKSMWPWPSLIWSPEPSSPEETQIVMPSKRAAL